MTLSPKYEVFIELPFAGIMRNGTITENKPWIKRIGYGGKLWPTPMARLGIRRGPQGKRYVQKGRSIELDDAVDHFGPTDAPEGVTARPRPLLWPTPRSADHRAGDELTRSEERKNGKNLLSVVKMFPTPTVQDSANNGGEAQFRRNSLPLNAVAGGSLNPEWVGWLMGFPTKWTEV